MSIKSNTPLLLIITVSLILFISAFVWKFMHVDNSETITPLQINEQLQPTKKISKPASTIQQSYSSNDNSSNFNNNESNKTPVTADSRVNRKKLERKLNMSLMFKKPEQVMDAIHVLQKQGKDDLANEYLDYLIETFPDFDIESYNS